MNTAAAIQPFDALDTDTEAALRESIKKFGVVVPIVVDRHARIIDGHHRARIARELNITCPQVVRNVKDDDDANALAYSLNADRRHMTREDRMKVVVHLREQGYSLRAIAGAVGVSDAQVRRDIEKDEQVRPPVAPDAFSPPPDVDAETGEVKDPVEPAPRVQGRDGKSYPKKSPLKHNTKNGRNPEATEERRAAIRRLAEEGNSSAQIAIALNLSRSTVLDHAKAGGFTIPADAILAQVRKPDPNVVMENTVQAALDLCEGLDAYVDFAELDGDHLAGWVSSLETAIRSLQTLKRNLTKELTR